MVSVIGQTLAKTAPTANPQTISNLVNGACGSKRLLSANTQAARRQVIVATTR